MSTAMAILMIVGQPSNTVRCLSQQGTLWWQPFLSMDSEVHEFNFEDGAKFLLAMAHKRKRTSDEAEASQELAKQLGGLLLALSQMAALINARKLLHTGVSGNARQV
jgi:hypothetical protein